ncbi:Hypothetical protein D9617_74g064600 [Elsinoe fawcettii]|nr:Hypothetical protein D9617_74g064600 [Elsinoe fawcettii]
MVKVGWGEECTKLVRQSRRVRRRCIQTHIEVDCEAYRTISNEKNSRIRKETTIAWREAVENISRDPKEMWKLAKWAGVSASQPPPVPQLPPLQDSEGTQHDKTETRVDILAAHLFPPSRVADLQDPEGHQYPTELDVSQDVSEEEVVKVLKAFAPDKAPGPDGITNRMLRECSGVLAPILAPFFPRLSPFVSPPCTLPPFQHRYSPQTPKAILQSLEKVVAQRLSKAADAHKLLPGTQMGARPRRSSITARELLTGQIKTVWAKGDKLVACLLSLDISGAYDNVSHERLLHNLCDAGIPQWMVT